MDEQERKLRKRLEQQLGTEFCSEDDLIEESKRAEEERRVDPSTGENRPQISVSELILHCQEMADRQGIANQTKFLLLNCATAMRQLVDRLAFYEDPKKVN
jgi:hypothetical protein